MPPPNLVYKIHSSATIDIKASDSLNSKNTIVRKIQLINRDDNSLYREFLIKASTLNMNENIFSAIKSKKFTGSFEIIADG